MNTGPSDTKDTTRPCEFVCLFGIVLVSHRGRGSKGNNLEESLLNRLDVLCKMRGEVSAESEEVQLEQKE